MKLVYLWVDNDVTIQSCHEFNFGSEYFFTFTNEEKLQIIPNQNYIENLYGNNINISSVVGSNGVGKSQLLKIIWNGDTHERYFAIVFIDEEYRLIGAELDGQVTLPLGHDFENLLLEIKLIEHDDRKHPLISATAFLFTNDAICLDPVQNSRRIFENQKFSSIECAIKNIINSRARENFSILSEIEKKVTDTDKSLQLNQKLQGNILFYEKLKFEIESKLFEQALEIIYDDNICWHDDLKKPESIFIDIDVQKWDRLIKIPNILLPELKNNISLSEKVFFYYSIAWFNQVKQTLNLPDEVLDCYSTIYSRYFEKIAVVNKDNFFADIINEYSYVENKEPIHTIFFSLSRNYFNALNELYNSLKIYQSNPAKIDKELYIKIAESHLQLINESTAVDPILVYKFLPIMSSGHMYTITTFANLYDTLKNIEDNNIFLLLDEIEVFLHPNWQRKFVSLLLNFLKSKFYNKNIHIIMATHSPFVLSDIPNENIVFLDGDFSNTQTFGANIHTLLSHGFFMKDGLMGEFAKEKIQSIIKYHEEIKNKDLLKDEHRQLREEEKEEYEKDKKNNFWNIQSIIGDDYLKQVIKNHLVEIEKILYKDMYLDNEIERMKKELKKLEALKNA